MLSFKPRPPRLAVPLWLYVRITPKKTRRWKPFLLYSASTSSIKPAYPDFPHFPLSLSSQSYLGRPSPAISGKIPMSSAVHDPGQDKDGPHGLGEPEERDETEGQGTQTTPRRPRGRPRGSKNKPEASPTAPVAGSSSAVTPKKRGRPPKKKDDSGIDEPPPKRKRGRPPKNPNPDTTGDAPPKKKRGRPPKKTEG